MSRGFHTRGSIISRLAVCVCVWMLLGQLRCRARGVTRPRTANRQHFLLSTRVRTKFTSHSSKALARAGTTAVGELTPIEITRRAERLRFGLPVWQLLAGGLLGAALVFRWFLLNRREEWAPKQPPEIHLPPFAIVREAKQVEALLDEVRVVLSRHGLELWRVPLRVRLLSNAESHVEGTTTKVVRPPPALRGIEAVSLRPGLTALHTAQILAHEYMHCWLWLQNFPILEVRVEEGLCELISYLYLLSCLNEPVADSVLGHSEEGLREQILSIEANAHPDYGGGFRECVEALRGRTLHELLSHVREHARLPPPTGRTTDTRGEKTL
jgi:hypothetical protein